jgi:hypothetical protein
MKKVFLILFLIFSSDGLKAAGEYTVPGGKPAGMGFSAVASGGLWSVCANPAGMAFSKGLAVGIYAENRFLIPDLATGAAAISFGSKAGAFGGYVSRFGNEHYSELKVVAGYARKFGKKFSAGLVFDYLLISQDEFYGNRNALSFGAGLMFRPDSKWAIGVHVINPVPINLTPDKTEKLPTVFRAGFSRVFSGNVELAAEIEKSLDGKAVFRTGLEYRLPKILALRMGFASQPRTITGGVGLAFGSMHLDIASSWQPELGYSPQVGLEWKIGKKNNDK